MRSAPWRKEGGRLSRACMRRRRERVVVAGDFSPSTLGGDMAATLPPMKFGRAGAKFIRHPQVFQTGHERHSGAYARGISHCDDGYGAVAVFGYELCRRR